MKNRGWETDLKDDDEPDIRPQGPDELDHKHSVGLDSFHPSLAGDEHADCQNRKQIERSPPYNGPGSEACGGGRVASEVSTSAVHLSYVHPTISLSHLE